MNSKKAVYTVIDKHKGYNRSTLRRSLKNDKSTNNRKLTMCRAKYRQYIYKGAILEKVIIHHSIHN